MPVRIHSYLLLCLFLFSVATGALAGPSRNGDPFLSFIRQSLEAIPPASAGAYRVPTGEELEAWSLALNHFRAGRPDSCNALLAGFNYGMTTVKDAVSGATFDIISENTPITRGWGTLIHNREHRKRLNVHVNHPVEDGNVAVIGAELFRRAGAKWMLIGGSSKAAVAGSNDADLAQNGNSVFQRLHELLAGADEVSVSLHAYKPDHYSFPISVSDVIISNGRTSDDQWGISQFSLSLRDSLRLGGFHTALAMLDSGFARLSGGGNPQGIHSNDNAGFGRWMNVELSSGVRHSQREYLRFVRAADGALGVTRKTAGRRDENAFGLVSPRVLKLDKANKLRFPPREKEKYRIVSFSPGQTKNDTLDLLFGNWLDSRGKGTGRVRIVEYDTVGSIAGTRRYERGHARLEGTVTKLVSASSSGKLSSGIRPVEHRPADTLLAGEEAGDAYEPIQVHRIPLRPVLAATVHPEQAPVTTPFHWGGILPEGFTPQLFTFQSGQPAGSDVDIPGLSRFLIPLLRNSYQGGGLRYVGVDMTDILVNEIARLVSEYRVEGTEIGMMAEQSESGDYYLRLFPEAATDNSSSNLP